MIATAKVMDWTFVTATQATSPAPGFACSTRSTRLPRAATVPGLAGSCYVVLSTDTAADQRQH